MVVDNELDNDVAGIVVVEIGFENPVKSCKDNFCLGH